MTHKADAKQMLDDRGYTGSLVRGQNPALLMEKAVRDRITDSYYWKEQCFGLNEATICDRAVDLTHIGGVAGTSQRPTPFLCLAFKLLQLSPEREIVLEYLHNEDFKSVGGDVGVGVGSSKLMIECVTDTFERLRHSTSG